MSTPFATPSLEEIAENPGRARALSPKVAADLLSPCESLLLRYQRVRDELLIRASATAGASEKPDLFDDIEEAARLIGRTPHFIYRNHRSLPFVIQEGKRRRLRFSRKRIERFLENPSKGP